MSAIFDPDAPDVAYSNPFGELYRMWFVGRSEVGHQPYVMAQDGPGSDPVCYEDPSGRSWGGTDTFRSIARAVRSTCRMSHVRAS